MECFDQKDVDRAIENGCNEVTDIDKHEHAFRLSLIVTLAKDIQKLAQEQINDLMRS